MSEALAVTDWAHSEDMEHWRSEVAGYLQKRKEEGVSSQSSLESKDAEKAAHAMYLLANKGLSIRKAAEGAGISQIMLRRTATHYLTSLEKWRPDLVAKLTAVTFAAAEALSMKFDQLIEDPEELKKVSVDKLAVAFGIVNDKNLHHQGQSTASFEVKIGVTIEDAAAAIADAKRQAAEKMRQTAIDV